MFQSCFLYNYKGPCYIYYLETLIQKRFYKDLIQNNNNSKIEAKARAKFDKQQAEILEEQRIKGKKKSRKPASWEAFWNRYKQKRNRKYKGGIDNIRYTYKCLIPLLIPFIHEINLQIHNPNKYDYDIQKFIFQQDGAPSHSS